MPIQRLDQDGIRAATHELSAGREIILPFPSPLPYVIAGTSADGVNTVKGRPAEQSTGMAIADAADILPYIALDPESWQFAEWASRARKVNVLVPVTDAVPDWVRPTVVAGQAAITLAWLPELLPLLDGFRHLYLSSANRTKHEVATTAHAAGTEFPNLLVLDGDRLRDASTKSGSAAIVRFDRQLAASVHRSGIHMDGWPDASSFLADLKRDWQASRAS
jgi:tRNA A37 threonylcarbamoyladenosine synthetase subunit TsaC/SUA5/YrdC